MVVQLSDIHLRPPRVQPPSRADRILGGFRRIGSWLAGRAVPTEPDLALLRDALERVFQEATRDCADAQLSLIVTGDVDDVGLSSQDGERRPGLARLRAALGVASFQGERSVNVGDDNRTVPYFEVFGNHDIWEGNWPILRRLDGGLRSACEDFPLSLYLAESLIPSAPTSGPGLAIFAINTVSPTRAAGSLAFGRAFPVPPSTTGASAYPAATAGAAVPRIAVAHHPFVAQGAQGRLTHATRGGKRLARKLADSHQVRYLLCGHTHRPSSIVSAAGRVLQLTAPSLTRARTGPTEGTNSFVVYVFDSESGTSVSRQLWSHHIGLATDTYKAEETGAWAYTGSGFVESTKKK